MINAVKNTISELKKVTWPTRKDLISYTMVVIVFMVLMAVVVGVLDLGASDLISRIITR
jgi:preprotein translocase subunit SecE